MKTHFYTHTNKKPDSRLVRDGLHYAIRTLRVLIKKFKENLNEEVEEPLAAADLPVTS